MTGVTSRRQFPPRCHLYSVNIHNYVCICIHNQQYSTIISYSIDVAVAFDSFETGFSYGKTEAYHSVFPGLEFCCALIPLFRPCALAFLGRGLADAGWFGNAGRLPKPKQTYAEVPNLSTSFFWVSAVSGQVGKASNS